MGMGTGAALGAVYITHGEGPAAARRIIMSDQSGPRRGFQVSTSARIIRLTSDSEGVLAPPEVGLSSTYGTFTSRTRGVGLGVAPDALSHYPPPLRNPGPHLPARH